MEEYRKDTAISKLINYFEQELRLHKTGEYKFTVEEKLFDAIEVCKNAIKLEKQQIKDAYNQGYREGELNGELADPEHKDISEFVNAEQYYEDL